VQAGRFDRPFLLAAALMRGAWIQGFRCFILILACATAAPAGAKNLLPLRIGIYLEAGTPCAMASDATILSYWGGTNGINDAWLGCTIQSYRRHGRVYELTRICEDIDDTEKSVDHQTLTVIGDEAFIVHDTKYRYCGANEQSILGLP